MTNSQWMLVIFWVLVFMIVWEFGKGWIQKSK